MTFRSHIPVALALAALASASLCGASTQAAGLVATPPAPRSASSAERTAGGDWPPPAMRVSWAAVVRPRDAKHLRILAINDFHGNLERPSIGSARPAGGAAVLAAYLSAAEREAPDRTLIVHAGDQLGASPPITRLNGNEPAITFLNRLANGHCAYGEATHFFDAASWRERPDRCNVIGTLGNHEFDAGPHEIVRLLEGGNAPGGPYLENPWRGSRVPYVCANVRNRRTGELILPPYAVVVVDGIPIGVIGAVVRETPILVPASATADLEFLDEADSINRAAAELERRGVHTIIVAIHQGLVGTRTARGWNWEGPLRGIVARLDPDIDVVISGHTHHFTNTLLADRTGRPVLVTQAYSYGVAYADIDLWVDPRSLDVVAKSARIVPTWDDAGPGMHPDARVAALTAAAERAVRPRISKVIAHAGAPITRAITPAGESALGDLVADAQRAAMGTDMALMNPGGLRSDLRAGPITLGDILTLHPFGNRLVTLTLTGAQVLEALEEQWPRDPEALPRVLKTSGLVYVWDPTRPAGHHVVAACDAEGKPLEPSKDYRVTINDFLAGGGDNFILFKQMPAGIVGPLDSEALAQYLSSRPGPISVRTDGRIAIARDGTAASLCALRTSGAR
jgi:5'-nucleotidase